ncbi:Hypothetical predicted protein [Cloeon dipterum]|uniref:Bee-milk protein n=1 Tax=Cloeon dipterum TaxID=197152 RepID=A0A8S1DHD2_9INSE|nr:Hypothetical predicted protein [Cloeon dipterum]
MSRSMTPFFVSVFLLGLSSVATAKKLTRLVYEWPDKMDCEWPSKATRTRALSDEISIEPHFMAVYRTRIFFVLKKYPEDTPAKVVVSLPKSSGSSEPPRPNPFPSLDMYEFGNCQKIEEPSGLAVDSLGRLWVLDRGSSKCNSKILTIDLRNHDQTKVIHQFSFHDWIHDLVLDETNNGTFAYITRWDEQCLVVFCLERNESWIVETPKVQSFAIALSPKYHEPRQLYIGIYSHVFGEWNSNELLSISVAALRNGTRTAYPKLIANLTGEPYRMVVDNRGTMYAGFFNKNYISSWNGSQPFQEQRYFENNFGIQLVAPAPVCHHPELLLP